MIFSKGVNLLEDVVTYAKQLVTDGAEDKIKLMVNLLKPAVVESNSMFVSYKPISVNMNNSDFKIIKCFLSNPFSSYQQ